MRRTRVIPVLLLKGAGLVKTTRFADSRYVGDPINAVKIFNDKEVDEIAVLDITASREKRGPNLEFIREFASESFMPFCFGGGIRNLQDIEDIFRGGVEKVSINTQLFDNPDLITEAAKVFGNQSIVASIDVKKTLLGKYRVARFEGDKLKTTQWDPVEFAIMMQEKGAGEILLNSVDRDGTGSGYDLSMIHQVCDKVSIPVVACGGAGKHEDFAEAVQSGASAVAAGRMFVFYGKHLAVLINYPEAAVLDNTLP